MQPQKGKKKPQAQAAKRQKRSRARQRWEAGSDANPHARRSTTLYPCLHLNRA